MNGECFFFFHLTDEVESPKMEQSEYSLMFSKQQRQVERHSI
jgi:hypothetical protein